MNTQNSKEKEPPKVQAKLYQNTSQCVTYVLTTKRIMIIYKLLIIVKF